MISGLLLSAGLSTRFGTPKALACINSETAITSLLQQATASSLNEIIVVLGADSELIEPCLFKHRMIRVVHNKHYKFGQTSSVQAALQTLPEKTSGFMILPVDCPFIKSTTIEILITHFKTIHPDILIPTHQHRRGHPPLFDIKFKEHIMKLTQSEGLNKILHEHPESIRTVEINDPGITQSFNTPEELIAIKKSMGIE